MIRSLLATTFVLAAVASSIRADGAVPVTLPDVPAMDAFAAEKLLTDLVIANVISSNCDAYMTDMADWGLLTGTADIIAYDRLGLSVGDYEDRFYTPAFALLDLAGSCDLYGPNVAVMLDQIAAWGGLPYVE